MRGKQMTVFSVGQATIARVEETFGPTYPAAELFPEWNDKILAEHEHWLAPNHYDPPSRRIKLSVHSWLLEIGGQKILIDACCGNNRDKPGRPFWHMLNVPYLDRLAAAGARPQDIDLVMCTHLHHDHVGWNTQLSDGRWLPTFPNARYVFSKPDFDHFYKLDADPKQGPAEMGTFRECVLPIVEAGRADLVTGPHRLNEHLEILPAPGHSPGHFVFNLESRGQRATFIGDVFHHLLQVYYPHWNFPKNSDADQARVSRRKVLEHCATSGALTLPGHVGAPFAGYIESTETGFRPRF
jgi:glyoxylase-like metal-dependent hydrolase (beta-lactamase superfamily II)